MNDLTALLFKPFKKFEETVGEISELIPRERKARVRAETANRLSNDRRARVAKFNDFNRRLYRIA